MRRLQVLAKAAKAMDIPVITLCTGTRDPVDKWHEHPDNNLPDAWSDLCTAMEQALTIADEYDLMLGIEPELANVVNSAYKASRLIKEMASPRLRIIFDPANLFEIAIPRRTAPPHQRSPGSPLRSPRHGPRQRPPSQRHLLPRRPRHHRLHPLPPSPTIPQFHRPTCIAWVRRGGCRGLCWVSKRAKRLTEKIHVSPNFTKTFMDPGSESGKTVFLESH